MTLLLIPVLPAAICGALSVGHRAGGWLALSWVVTFGISAAIILMRAPIEVSSSEEVIELIGIATHTTLMMSLYWAVSAVPIFYGVRLFRADRDAGGAQ